MLASHFNCFKKMTVGVVFLSAIFVLLFASIRISYAIERNDLSAGIANPSNNGAISENPAVLGQFQNSVFDLGALFSSGSSPDFLGSYSSGKGSMGYGVQLLGREGQYTPTVGFGASAGGFAVGLNGTSSLSSFSPVFSLGLRQELQKMAVAFMWDDIGTFLKDWTFGFGFTSFAQTKLGLDFHMTNQASTLGITGASVIGSVEFFSNQKFSFKAAYSVVAVPSIDLNQRGLELGLNVWMSPKASLYGLYHPEGYQYVVGFKFLN